jgi:gamma-glutamylcyclotransferase (GGCT)/AIG2-like uncharacterized protein YtfP
MSQNEKIRRWIKRHENKHTCSCGCGDTIEILPIHYRRGVPAFIKGHNFCSDYNPRIEDPLELDRKSTTWEMLSEEEKDRRLANLKRFGKMEEHPQWKGGRLYDESGYVKIRMPEHPHAVDGYLLEHRFVMEEFLRKDYPSSPYLTRIKGELYLKNETVVHHIDEIKSNNVMDNLFIFPDNAAHIFWHKSHLSEYEKIRRIKAGLYRTNVDEEKLKPDDDK